MKAINWIKKNHSPYDGEIDYDVIDEENHNYQYYLDYYTNPISKLFDENIIKNEIVKISLNENNDINFPSIFINLKELHLNYNDTLIFNSSFPLLEKLILKGQKLIITKTQPNLNYLSFTANKNISYKNDYNKIEEKTTFILSAKRDFFDYNSIFVPKLKTLNIYNCRFENIYNVNVDNFEINKYFNMIILFRKCNIKNLSLQTHYDLIITNNINNISEISRFNNFYQNFNFLRAIFIKSNIININCLCKFLIIDINDINLLKTNANEIFIKQQNNIKKINFKLREYEQNELINDVKNILIEKKYIHINNLDKLFNYFTNIHYVNINFSFNDMLLSNLILYNVKFKNCNIKNIINCVFNKLIIDNTNINLTNCNIEKLIIKGKSKINIENCKINSFVNNNKNVKIKNSIIKFD